MTKRRLAITEHPSPNFNERPDNADIDMLVIHYTGMPSAEAAIEWLAHPASRVSAHYLIDEDGRVVRMVEEEKRAWHAGVSHWRGRDNVNDCSIGIELVNPGHEWGYRPFPEAQMAALEALAADICARPSDPADPGCRPCRCRARPQDRSGRAFRLGAACARGYRQGARAWRGHRRNGHDP